MLFVRRLIGDSANVEHTARHEVTPNEVEEVCHGKPLLSENTYDRRLRVIGTSGTGRLLTIILAPKGGNIYYPVTARTADSKERRQYRENFKDMQL